MSDVKGTQWAGGSVSEFAGENYFGDFSCVDLLKGLSYCPLIVEFLDGVASSTKPDLFGLVKSGRIP